MQFDDWSHTQQLSTYHVRCISWWPFELFVFFLLLLYFIYFTLAIVVNFARIFERRSAIVDTLARHKFFFSATIYAHSQAPVYSIIFVVAVFLAHTACTQQTHIHTNRQQATANGKMLLHCFILVFNRLVVFIVFLRARPVSIGISYCSRANKFTATTTIQCAPNSTTCSSSSSLLLLLLLLLQSHHWIVHDPGQFCWNGILRFIDKRVAIQFWMYEPTVVYTFYITRNFPHG